MSTVSSAENLLKEGVDKGDIQKIREALNAKASPNTIFNEGWNWSVLDRALFNGVVPIVELLLDAGADVNHIDSQNENCLFKAVELRNLDLVKKIVDKGVHVNQVSNDQELTPVCIALIGRNLEMVEYLVGKGAIINPFNSDGSVPFSLIIDNAEDDEDLSALIDFLVKAGLDVNAQDHKGWTSLMKTVRKNMKKTMVHLIKKGAEVNLKNEQGGSAVMEAACKEDTDFINLILSAGGNPNLSLPGGFSPLMVACKFGFLNVCEMLVKAGAEVNARDRAGLTPLMYATSRNAEVVKYLLEMKADRSLKCNEGKTALDYAEQFENQEARDAIRE